MTEARCTRIACANHNGDRCSLDGITIDMDGYCHNMTKEYPDSCCEICGTDKLYKDELCECVKCGRNFCGECQGDEDETNRLWCVECSNGPEEGGGGVSS